MNCPGHALIYSMGLHSYRDLPIRYHEQTALHRNEASGTLSGLTRVRQFSQDDAHIYLRRDQIGAEIKSLLALVARVYKLFDLKYEMRLSTRNPDKFMGEIPVWDEAEAMLKQALVDNDIQYELTPGDAAFYGPKIDLVVSDAIGRKWQCATIQLDFLQPERFDLHYVDEHSARQRPVVIHRAIYGSFERFLAMLTEHYAGAFPTWLAPVQARGLVVSEKQEEYAQNLLATLKARGIRADLDLSNDKLGAKIRRAQLEKIPYMLVVGDKEVASGTVAARLRDGKQLEPMALDALCDRIADEAKLPL
jgi:threonyl-tRNA synthetase